MLRLVLFDIDGTLLHTNRAGLRAFDRALATEFNVPHGTEGLQFAGRTDTGLVREIFLKHNLDTTPENFARFFDAYAHWLAHYLAEGKGNVCPGAQQFMDDLQRLPQPPVLGLLTGNIRLGAELKLRHFNLWEYFALGAFADDAEDRGHIAAVARQRGAELLGETLRGDELLVIGDTPLDIACARFIQAKVLAVATGIFTVEELRAHQPDWVAADLTRVDIGEIFAAPPAGKKRSKSKGAKSG